MLATNAYKTKDLLGIIFNSKYRSGKLISMSQKFWNKNSRERYPGPGSYIRFSEFCILVYKKAIEKTKKKLKILLVIKSQKLRQMKQQMLKQLKMKLLNL